MSTINSFSLTVLLVITLSLQCVFTRKPDTIVRKISIPHNALSVNKYDPLIDSSFYKYLSNFSNYPDFPKENNGTLIFYKDPHFGDIPFRVTVPLTYNKNKANPAVLLLHGATGLNSFSSVVNNYKDFSAEEKRELSVKLFKDTALERNYIIIEAFADNRKSFNWLIIKDNVSNALHSIENFIRNLKGKVNIDDSKLYIIGHSDGSDGAWALMNKKPSMFGSALLYNPMGTILRSPTHLKNFVNRSIYIVHSDLDDIRPINQTREIVKALDTLQATFVYKEFIGYKHGDTHLNKDISFGFDYLNAHVRDPFQSDLYWETDDVSFGTCDWLKINKLNLALPKSPWHISHNVKLYNKITKVFTNNEYYQLTPSGAVKAHLYNNTFYLETSRIAQLELLISPVMVNLDNPVKVIINSHEVFNQKLNLSKGFMQENFELNKDKQAIWVNSVKVDVP